MKLTGEHSCSAKKFVQLPLCPTEISQILAWDRTLASAVAGETGLNDIQEFTYQVSIKKLINSASNDHDTKIVVIRRC
jgi:hypothetical protein